MPKKNKTNDYLVYNFDPPSMECKLCCSKTALPLPMPLPMACDMLKSFSKIHKPCLKDEKLIANYMTKRLLANERDSKNKQQVL